MMDNHRMLMEAGQATFLSGGDAITRCCITMTTDLQGMGDYSLPLQVKSTIPISRVTRAGAVQDQAHLV